MGKHRRRNRPKTEELGIPEEAEATLDRIWDERTWERQSGVMADSHLPPIEETFAMLAARHNRGTDPDERLRELEARFRQSHPGKLVEIDPATGDAVADDGLPIAPPRMRGRRRR